MAGAAAEDPGPSSPAETIDETNTTIKNPLIGNQALFHPYDPSVPPIYIGEAACTAISTRFRTFLSGTSTTSHIPRVQYVKDATIAVASELDVPWPTLQQARILLKISMHQIDHLHHMFLRKSTLDKLEDIYRTGTFGCAANKAKYFALFAFGEAYSMRSEPLAGSVPGTLYFAKALSLVQIVPERPSMIHLETLLLLVCH